MINKTKQYFEEFGRLAQTKLWQLKPGFLKTASTPKYKVAQCKIRHSMIIGIQQYLKEFGLSAQTKTGTGEDS